MAKKQDAKKQHVPTYSPSTKATKQDKQPPSSPGLPLSTKSLVKSATTVTKQAKQPPPLLSDTSSASSLDGDESPRSSSMEKPAGAFTTADFRKHTELSSNPTDVLEEEEDEGSETDTESKEDDSANDSAPVAAKPNPPPLLEASREGKGKRSSSSTSSSGSDTEDVKSDGVEADSSSESDQPHPPPPKKQHGNIALKAEAPIAEKNFDSSANSDQANPSPHKTPLSAAAPLSSKLVSSPAQPVDKSGINTAVPSSISVSKEKRKRANDISKEVGQEKKVPFRRIWSDEDELELLRVILEYKERYHIIPSTLTQLEPLYASIKGLMSIPATSNQMHEKVRRMKQKYNNKARKNYSMTPSSLNAHDAAVFDLSKKIWCYTKNECSVPEKMIKGEKMKNIKNLKVKGKQFPMEYPSLHRVIKYEIANIPLILQFSHIPNAKSNKLEGKCEKLEITEIRLHAKKQELLSAALELIDGALANVDNDAVAGC